MKVFIAGSKKPHSYEVFCAEEFKRKGCNVLLWNSRASTLLSPLKRMPGELSRLGNEFYSYERSIAFLKAMRKNKPDLLFLLKANNIHSRAIKIGLEETNAKMVMWYPDNPFWANQTTINVIRNLRVCDIYYSWGKFLIETLKSAGCRRVEYLPFGFYPDFFPTDINISQEDHKLYGCDICFVGTWDAEREKKLEPLAEFDLAIWGPRWKQNVKPSSPLYNNIRSDGLYGTDMVKAYRCARLVFNQLRFHNGDSHNVRAMEIAGIGAVQIVRRTTELSTGLFKEGEHLLCYNTTAELLSMLHKLPAEHNSLNRMQKDAQEHVKKHHLLKYRISQIISDVREMNA